MGREGDGDYWHPLSCCKWRIWRATEKHKLVWSRYWKPTLSRISLIKLLRTSTTCIPYTFANGNWISQWYLWSSYWKPTPSKIYLLKLKETGLSMISLIKVLGTTTHHDICDQASRNWHSPRSYLNHVWVHSGGSVMLRIVWHKRILDSTMLQMKTVTTQKIYHIFCFSAAPAGL